MAFVTNLNLYIPEKTSEGGSNIRLPGSDRLARDGAWSKIRLAYMVGVVATPCGYREARALGSSSEIPINSGMLVLEAHSSLISLDYQFEVFQ